MMMDEGLVDVMEVFLILGELKLYLIGWLEFLVGMVELYMGFFKFFFVSMNWLIFV